MPDVDAIDVAAEAVTELDEAKLAAARLWACQRWPYFTSGFLALQPVCEPGLGTFAIDKHWRLYLDPQALEKWTTRQVGVVLNHELQHLLRDHAGRAHNLGVAFEQRRSWNLAADAEINDDLFAELLDEDAESLTPVTPASLGSEPGKLAEHYFQLIREDEHDQVADEGSGVHGFPRDGELPADAESVKLSEATMLRGAIAAAVVAHAKSHGNLGGGLQRWATAQLGLSQDWRRLLAASVRRNVATTAGLADYSYQRLSRRSSAADGVIFPAMVKPALHISIVIDTSASVTDEMLGHALREISTITKSVTGRGGSVVLIACDAAADRARRVTTTSAVGLPLLGGGGTDMRQGIDHALAQHPKPSAIVVLTDGYSPWPDTAPTVPVTIGLIGNDDHSYSPEWATTVVIDSA